jgi:hypothetical protein
MPQMVAGAALDGEDDVALAALELSPLLRG